MSEPTMKPHYFELSMRSVSNGQLNQECPIVREYANTPGELCLKQMEFTKDTAEAIAKIVVAAMDKMSKPIQDIGAAEMVEAMKEFSAGKGNGKPNK